MTEFSAPMTTLSPEARARLEGWALRYDVVRGHAFRANDDVNAALSTIDSLTAEVERLRESVSASAAQYDAKEPT